jgi:mono/diheme cytochrome c family protein
MTLTRYASLLCTATMITMLMSSVGANAQSDGITAQSAARGLERARLWCAQCHVVEVDSPATTVTEAPSFHHIANLDDQSELKIRGFLQVPHLPMPNLDLTRAEIKDLTTYIWSLRDLPQ